VVGAVGIWDLGCVVSVICGVVLCVVVRWLVVMGVTGDRCCQLSHHAQIDGRPLDEKMAPYSKRFVGTATKYELHPFSRLISAQASRRKSRRNDKKHPSQNRRAVQQNERQHQLLHQRKHPTTRKDATHKMNHLRAD
jgi:hypothetical protein